MNARSTNLSLQITTAVLIVLTLAALVAGLVTPLDIEQPANAPVQSWARAAHAAALPSVDSFSPLFSRSLQSPDPGSIAAAPAATDTAAEPAAVVSQLSLVGTIGTSVALIKGPDGTVAMVEVGDDVNGSPVLAIRPSQVDLRVNGKTTTLQKPSVPDDSSIILRKQ